MVNFRDRINDNLAKASNDQCQPGGRVIDYKTKLPPVIPSEGVPPGGEAPGISPVLEDKLDTIINLLSKYKGSKFSSKILSTQARTPIEIAFDNTQPSPDSSIIGFYDSIDVHNSKSPPSNAEVVWVICDGPVDLADPFIYVRSSPDRKGFSQEIPVRLGEKWGFEDVYELRVRGAFTSVPGSNLGGTQYRASEYDNQLTYVSVVVNTPVNIPINIAANRPDFVDLNIPINMVDSVLPNITIPDGFDLAIRSSVDNPFGSRIYSSKIDATTPATRNTLLPGDVKEYSITNANLIHVAGDRDGLSLDISVEL